MAEESFADAEVAQLLNDGFVSVKVDREERPDIDEVYMRACTAMSGQGGWPLTVLLGHDKNVFFAGTYFPKKSKYGRYGLLDILNSALRLWKSDRARLTLLGEEVQTLITDSERPSAVRPSLTANLFKTAFNNFESNFDEQNGGFGYAPKFPSAHNLMFLMRYRYYENSDRAEQCALKTLDQMYRGGIFDHIGGGFSRYSTDEKWLVPHFEKMLYDNAMLVIAYLEAFELTGKSFYRRVAEHALEFVLREMTGSEGRFYSAQDADSDGREGKYYLWSRDEFAALLGKRDAKLWCNHFGVSSHGNFEGENVLNLLDNPNFDKENDLINELIPTVLAHRCTRNVLKTDDKTLTSTSAMMVTAFSKAYAVTGNDLYLTAAENCVSFIDSTMTGSNGRLNVSYREGQASGTGYLDDYAFLGLAKLSLYESAFDVRYLEGAVRVAQCIIDHFSDKDSGGYYSYPHDGEQLIARLKTTYDGAVPSGNSAAAMLLNKLSKLTGGHLFAEESDRQLEFLSHELQKGSAGFALCAAMLKLYPSRELICVMNSGSDIAGLQLVLREVFAPDLSVIVITGTNRERLVKLAPYTARYGGADNNNKPTFYLCQNSVCSLPITNLSELRRKLSSRVTAATH